MTSDLANDLEIVLLDLFWQSLWARIANPRDRDLDGRNKSFFAGYAGLSGSISQSALITPNGGYVIDSKGVRTISFGLGAGFSGGIGVSKGGVWEPFK